MAQDRNFLGNQVVKKEDNWLDAIIIIAVAVVAFLFGTIYGKRLYGLQWETLLAGFLGLIGGTFALLSAQSQIKAQRQQRHEDILREESLHNYLYYSQMLAIGSSINIFCNFFSEKIEKKEIENKNLEVAIMRINSTTFPKIPITTHKEIIELVIDIKRNINNLKQALEKSITIDKSDTSSKQYKYCIYILKMYIDTINKTNANLVNILKNELKKLEHSHHTAPTNNELKSVPTGDMETRPTMPD